MINTKTVNIEESERQEIDSNIWARYIFSATKLYEYKLIHQGAANCTNYSVAARDFL